MKRSGWRRSRDTTLDADVLDELQCQEAWDAAVDGARPVALRPCLVCQKDTERLDQCCSDWCAYVQGSDTLDATGAARLERGL